MVDEVAELVARRREFLETIVETPVEKRRLVDELGRSRSTINRAINELEAAELVEETESGVVTSVTGGLLLDRYRSYLETVDSVESLRSVLEPLPRSVDLPLEPLECARGHAANGPDPYRPIEALSDVVGVDDRTGLVLPALPHPQLLERCRTAAADGVAIDLVLPPVLYEHLRERFPGVLVDVAGSGGTVAVGDDRRQFGVVTGVSEGPVAVVVFTDDHAVHGVIETERPEAVRWARQYVDRCLDTARDVTEDCRAIGAAEPAFADGTTGAVRSSSHSGSRDSVDGRTYARSSSVEQGFDRLTEGDLEASYDLSPMAAWQSEPSTADVAAGYVVDREYEREGERRSVATDLVDDLSAASNGALLGPSGSGKSATCRLVACRWLEEGLGPVYYRSSGAEEPVNDVDTLRAAADEAAGHPLFVVEDATRSDAAAALRLGAALEECSDASVLVDARDTEWRDPFDLDERELAARRAFDTVDVPPLDERECERFVHAFESTTGAELDVDGAALLEQVRNDVGGTERARDDHGNVDGAGDDAGDETAVPGEVLALLHRLAVAASPVDDAGDAETALDAVVRRTYEGARSHDGEVTFHVAVLANLLNAAGIDPDPGLLYALAPRGDRDAVRDAIDLLEGRVLFRSGEELRTVHEVWSMRFLERMLATDPEPVAARWFGRCLTELLALADRDGLRGRLAADHGGAVERIEEDPSGWVERTVERTFALGRRRPKLAPLYGRGEFTWIELPAAAPDGLAVDCVEWRGEMFLDRGDFEDARRTFELVAPDDEDACPEHRARRDARLGEVARRQGSFDEAERRYRQARDRFEDLDDPPRAARAERGLGVVAYRRGDLDASERHLVRALETLRTHGNAMDEADALFNLGNVVADRGNPGAALAHYRYSAEVYRALGHRRALADALGNVGVEYKKCGDLDEAARCYRRAAARYREIGDAFGVARCQLNLGSVDRQRAGYASAIDRFAEAHRTYDRMDATELAAIALRYIGEAALAIDDLVAADRYVSDAERLYREIGDSAGEVAAQTLQAGIAAARNDPAVAIDAAETALTTVEETGHERERVDAMIALGRARRIDGDVDGARRSLDCALDAANDLEYWSGKIDTLVELGLLARDRGDDVEAIERLERAILLATWNDAPGLVVDAAETLAVWMDDEGETGSADRYRSFADRYGPDSDLDTDPLDRVPR